MQKNKKISKEQQKLNKQMQLLLKQQKEDYFFTETPVLQTHIVASIFSNNNGNNQEQADQICLLENVCQDMNCYALFDCHGKCSKSIGIDLKSLLYSYIQTNSRKINWMNQEKNYTDFIKNMFHVIQKNLRKCMMNYSLSGATSVVVFAKKNRLFIGNIGNCQAILYKEKQSQKQALNYCIILTEDHIPENIKEKQRIKNKGGFIYKDVDKLGNSVGDYKIWKDNTADIPGLPFTRSFGNYEACEIGNIVTPHITFHDLKQGDKFLVLASNGLLNLLKPHQICGLINDYLENKEISNKDGLNDHIKDYCQKLIKLKILKGQNYENEDISYAIIFFNFEQQKLPFLIKSEFFQFSSNQYGQIQEIIPQSIFMKEINLPQIKQNLQQLPQQLKSFKSHIKNLKGTQIQTIIGGILPFGLGLLTVPLWAQTLVRCVNIEPNELDYIKNLPVLSGSIGRLVLGKYLSYNGGKKCGLYFAYLSLLGVILSFITNIGYGLENITSGHITYYLLGLGGLMMGFAVSNFQLLANAFFWGKVENAGHIQAVQSGLGNSFLGIFGLILINVLKWTEDINVGYILAIVLMIILIIFTYFLYQNPLNMQLQAQKVDNNDSKIIAEYLGQQNFASECNYASALKILDTYIFMLNYFLCFGGFLTLSGYIKDVVVIYHGEKPYTGLTQTFLFSMFTSLVRVFTGKLADKIGGYLQSQIALVLIMLGSLLGLLSPPLNAYSFLHISSLFINILGIGSMLSACYKWIIEVQYGQYCAISSLAGTLGGVGSLFFNMTIITQLKQQGNLIQGYWIFIIFSLVMLFINIAYKKLYLKF